MAIKTKETDESVADFIDAIDDEQKKKDCKELLKLMKKVSGHKPKLWNNGTVGFGTFHYKSAKSKQEGDWYLTGFAPRKTNLTIYVHSGHQAALLKKLGKVKAGGGCLYVNKLSDIDTKVLETMILSSMKFMKEQFNVK
jgi:hypothetical protein